MKNKICIFLIFLITSLPLFADTILTSTTTLWKNDTYILDSDLTIIDRINVERTVILNLNSNCKLTAAKGIDIAGNATLIINGEGTLESNGVSEIAGITLWGSLEINGGTIIANGGTNGAGIGGNHYYHLGNLIINGGNVTAIGKDGGAGIGGGNSVNWAGAYGGCGTVIINGGIVRAIGSLNGAGIGGGNGVSDTVAGGGYNLIEINGGQVYAESPNGYAIGPGSDFATPGVLKFGWSDFQNDYVEIHSNKGVKYSELVLSNQFRYENTGVDGCTPDIVNSENIKNQNIFPLVYRNVRFLIKHDFYTNSDSEKTFYGSKLFRPTDPVIQGLEFEGWYKDYALTEPWNFDTDIVYDNINLYANFIAQEIKLDVDEYYNISGNQANISPTVTSLSGDWILKNGIDYVCSYKDLSDNNVPVITQAGDYFLTITGIGAYSGKSVTEQIKVIRNMSGNGTVQDPYLINSDSDWELFVNNLSQGYDYTNSIIKLNCDLQISSSAGTEEYPFCGRLDGNGYAITAAADGPEFIFNYLEEANVKNLLTTFHTITQNSSGSNSIQNIQIVSSDILTEKINKKILSASGTVFYTGEMSVANLKTFYPYNSEPIELNPVFTVDGIKLAAGTDYTVSYKTKIGGNIVNSIIDVGDYIATYTGINNYAGQVSYVIKVPKDSEGILSQDNKGCWFVNIPADSSVKLIDISRVEKGFTFKIYDDGGVGGNYLSNAEGNYSKNASGWLLITVPQDYLIQISGYVATKSKYDYMTIYDGDDFNSSPLYENIHGLNNEEEYIVTLPAQNSSSNNVLVYFTGSASNCEGFELTATIVSKKQLKATQDKTAPGVFYTTWYTDEGNFLADSQAQVFYVQKTENGKVILKAAKNNFIKKGQGVIIKSTSPDIILYETGEPSDGYTYESLLKGTTTLLESTENLQGTVYAVSISEKGGVGFYKWEGEIPAKKAYLLIQGGEE